jgi:hypothetical protein
MRGAVAAQAGSGIAINANDSSNITANAGGVGIGIIAGSGEDGSAVSASVGVGIAINDIDNTVKAFIDDSTASAATTIALTSKEAAYLWALTIGGAVAASSGGESNGISLALAGADSVNTITNDVESYLLNSSSVTALGGAVTLTATDGSDIEANGGGLGIAVGISSEGTGAGVSIGESAAVNTIDNTVKATIDNSDVSATGADVALSATEGSQEWALTIGGAVSVGASGEGAGAGAGAGAG